MLLEPEPVLPELVGGGLEPASLPLPVLPPPDDTLGGGGLAGVTEWPALLAPEPAPAESEPTVELTGGADATVRVTGVLVAGADGAAGRAAWCRTGGGAGRT